VVIRRNDGGISTACQNPVLYFYYLWQVIRPMPADIYFLSAEASFRFRETAGRYKK